MFLCNRCVPTKNSSIKLDSNKGTSTDSSFGVKLNLNDKVKKDLYKVLDEEDEKVLNRNNSLKTIEKAADPTRGVIEYRNIPKTKKQVPLINTVTNKRLSKIKHNSVNSNNICNNNFTLVDALSVTGNLSTDNNENKRTNRNTTSTKKKNDIIETNHKYNNNDNSQNNSLISLFSGLCTEEKKSKHLKKRKKQHEERKKTLHEEKIIKSNKENIDLLNKMEMIKNLEMIKQLKEYENIHQFMELQKLQLVMKNSMCPYQYNYPMYYPPPPYYNQYPSYQMHSNPTKEKYCSYCEEIYKYTILNNTPLQKIKCVYCNNELNLESLDFFIKKYKKELQAKYQTQLVPPSEKESPDTSLSLSKSHKSIDNNTNENISMNNITASEIQAKKQTPNQSSSNSISIQNNLTDYDNMMMNNHVANNSNLTLNQPSLAEAFRSKRAKLYNRIQQRSKEAKEKLTHSKSSQAMNTLYLKLKNNIPIKPKSTRKEEENAKSQIEIKDSQFKQKKIKEPSKELMDRLINGKRAKMTKKEMKEVNNRLYKTLVDVQRKDDSYIKKEEMDKRVLKKKEYTDTLKDKVIMNYKNKK